jgi:hypothetical protein
MEQLIIKIADKEKAKMLSEILLALDFVSSVETIDEKVTISDDDDFFCLAGLWKNRDLTAESLRQEAWKLEKNS